MQVGDNRFGNDLLPAKTAPPSDELAIARHVPKRRVKATACQFDGTAIDRVVALVLGAHRLTQHLEDRICQGPASDAADDPAQNIAVGGAVGEFMSVTAPGPSQWVVS